MDHVPITFALAAAVIILFMGFRKAIFGLLFDLAPPGNDSGYGQLQSSTSMAKRTVDTDVHRHRRSRLRGPTRSRIEHLAAFAANQDANTGASSDLDMAPSPASTFTQITPNVEAVTPRYRAGSVVSFFNNTWATITGSAHAANHPVSVLTGS